MNTIVKKVLSDFLSEYGKIKLNSSIKKVKLDVGTSGDGPNTDLWLKENNICVIGVEPNLINLHNMYSKYEPQIKKEKLILLKTALSCSTPYIGELFCVKQNEGCSSLHEPVFDRIPEYKELSNLIFTPVIRLGDIFNFFPWEQVPFIDHLKIDAQGSDFDIVKGADDYLQEKIAFLTVEAGTGSDYKYDSKPQNMFDYIINKGFEEHSIKEFNWTFFNPRFESEKNKINSDVTG